MTEEHYILLLQKQLSEGISPEEKTRLETWLASSANHQIIAKGVQKAWEFSGGFSEEVELDLEEDFKLIEKRLTAEKEDHPPKVRPLMRRKLLLRIAAVFALLAAMPYILDKYLTPEAKYEVVTTKDEPFGKTIELVDGSKVWLNSDSKFTYFATSVGDERRVKIRGEAFFDVARDASKPFIVETPSGEVTVLGTSFGVRERKGEIEVHVASGHVKLSPKGSDNFIEMKKNEKGIYLKKSRQLISGPSHTLNELAWHTKKLVFNNTPLNEALQAINNFYGASVKVENKDLENCPIIATFPDKPLSTVIETLEKMLGAEGKKSGLKNYTLQGGSCELN